MHSLLICVLVTFIAGKSTEIFEVSSSKVQEDSNETPGNQLDIIRLHIEMKDSQEQR